MTVAHPARTRATISTQRLCIVLIYAPSGRLYDYPEAKERQRYRITKDSLLPEGIDSHEIVGAALGERVPAQITAPRTRATAPAMSFTPSRLTTSASEIRVPRIGIHSPGVRNPSFNLRSRGMAAHVKRYVVSRAPAEKSAMFAKVLMSARIVATMTWTTIATVGVRYCGCT